VCLYVYQSGLTHSERGSWPEIAVEWSLHSEQRVAVQFRYVFCLCEWSHMKISSLAMSWLGNLVVRALDLLLALDA